MSHIVKLNGMVYFFVQFIAKGEGKNVQFSGKHLLAASEIQSRPSLVIVLYIQCTFQIPKGDHSCLQSEKNN